MAHIVLILGGARSGKSRFAQELAERLGGDVLFVATAHAGDDEMRRRIARHQQERPASWTTVEATANVGTVLEERRPNVALVDCLTLLVSNIILANEHADEDQVRQAVEQEIDGLLRACAGFGGTVLVVSGEVGSGLVPGTPLGRQFRDLLGRANQAIAKRARAAYLLVAGIPVELKALEVNAAAAARALLSAKE